MTRRGLLLSLLPAKRVAWERRLERAALALTKAWNGWVKRMEKFSSASPDYRDTCAEEFYGRDVGAKFRDVEELMRDTA